MAQTKLDRAIRSSSQTFLFAFTGLVVAASAVTFASSYFSSSPKKGNGSSSFKDSLVSKKNRKDVPPEQKFVDTDEEETQVQQQQQKREGDEEQIEFDNKSEDPAHWTNDKLESWLKKRYVVVPTNVSRTQLISLVNALKSA